jgi:hypothetical protein
VTSVLPYEARTPTGRRLQLAALLRHLRREADLTQGEVGLRVWPGSRENSTQNKVALLESGDTGIELESLRRLLAEYGVQDKAIVHLAERLREGNLQRGRWNGYRAVYPPSHRRLIDLEEDSFLVRYVATEQPPENFMCDSYLRAGLGGPAGGSFAESPELQAQKARQQVLFRDDPPQCYAVLCESCVRRVRGSRAVMREQIQYLIKLSRLPHVSIQIAPFDLGKHRSRPGPPQTAEGSGILERFAMFRLAAPGLLDKIAGNLDFAFTMVTQELVQITDVQRSERIWNRATSAALTPTESRRLLKDVLADYD